TQRRPDAESGAFPSSFALVPDLRPPPAGLLMRPIDQIVERLVVRNALLAPRLAHGRDAAPVHFVAVAADEMMPVPEVLAFVYEPIRAGLRQPIELADRLRRQLHAVGHVLLAVGVVRALARVGVEQLA